MQRQMRGDRLELGVEATLVLGGIGAAAYKAWRAPLTPDEAWNLLAWAQHGFRHIWVDYSQLNILNTWLMHACYPNYRVVCSYPRFQVWHPGRRSAALALELGVQAFFFSAHLTPSYARETQWEPLATDLEALGRASQALFAGDVVQDLALRARIDVLPTYYVLGEVSDARLAEFLRDAPRRPTHFVLVDRTADAWRTQAPGFLRSLEGIRDYPIVLGELGPSTLRVYRIAARSR